jgi:hypothetical protein
MCRLARTFSSLSVYVDKHKKLGKRDPKVSRNQMATRPVINQRLSSLMKFNVPRMVLLGLFAFAAVSSASATQMKTSNPVFATEVAAVQAPVQAAGNPWPSLASMVGKQPGPLLAHDDGYWHDGRWHDRRDDWRRENWRREQDRREAERRRDWERHHDRDMQHRYEDDHRYYRR